MTPIQKAFAKSKVLRRGARDALAEEGAACATPVLCELLGLQTEAAIKALFYSFLQCYDLTPAERKEIKHLLQLSTTALTEEQRRQIYLYL